MMSISSLGAAGSGKAMYCQSQTSDEARIEGYYQTQSGEPDGEWHGSGLAAMGLLPGQKITDAQFNHLIRGRDLLGNDLVQGAGDEHRAGWDCTFSAPKSVSAAWAIANQAMREKISSAQAKATAAAIQTIEEKAAVARRGSGGKEFEKVPGLIVAQYEHCDSRELDPELHTHALILNLAQRQDGTWGGIESRQLYEWQHAAGAVYRAELAAQMQALGFQIEADRDYFKIQGIDDKLCSEWSKRRAQIESELAKAGIAPGSAKSSEIASLATRQAKKEQSREALFERWQAEALVHGLDSEYINKLAAGQIILETPVLVEGEEPAELYPESLYDHLTVNEAVFKEKDIYKTVAIRLQHEGRGKLEVDAAVKEAIANFAIVSLGDGKYTTRSMLRLEVEMVKTARDLNNNRQHAISNDNVKSALAEFTQNKGFSLSEEQVAAVKYVTSAGQLKIVRGAAGAGKSTMSEAAKIAFEKEGFKVVGAALAGKAAAGLEEGSKIKSHTIHKTLFQIQSGKIKLDDKSILLIDEAGMVGTKMMHQLTELSQKTGAKLVLVGDERQLQAVAAGGAFRLLQQELGEFAELNEVRRQKLQADVKAANDIADGQGSQALKSYIDRNMVSVGQTVDETKLIIADRYIQDENEPAEKIILAQRRSDVLDLNNLVRDKLSLTGTGHIIKTGSGEREFSIGDRILITKNDSKLGVKNGNLGEIKSIEFDQQGELKFTVKLDDQNQEISFTATGKGSFNKLDHGYAVTVHKSQGSTVNSAYFYASSFTDKELAYVAASRHRETFHLATAATKLEEALERAEQEALLAGESLATKKMQEYMQKIADKNQLDISNINKDSFFEVRAFLNDHAPKRLQDGDGTYKQEPTELEQAIIDMKLNEKEALLALSKSIERSHQKVNAVDSMSIEEAEALLEKIEEPDLKYIERIISEYDRDQALIKELQDHNQHMQDMLEHESELDQLKQAQQPAQPAQPEPEATPATQTQQLEDGLSL